MKVLIILLLSFNSFSMFAPRTQRKVLSPTSSKEFKGVLFKFQNIEQEHNGWFNSSPDEQIQGVSTNKYYQDLYELEGTVKKEIVVAVMDSGVDVNHQDLQGKIWINQKEIPNNNIDDDKNGYIDDVMGWNFIGSMNSPAKFKSNTSFLNRYELINNLDGQVVHETYEVTRELKRLKDIKKIFKENNLKLPRGINEKIRKYSKEVNAHYREAINSYNYYAKEETQFTKHSKVIKEALGIEILSLEALEKIKRPELQDSKKILVEYYEIYDYPLESILEGKSYYDAIANYNYNVNYDSRAEIVKDKGIPKFYGNNNVIGPDAFHGTHVAGIIAATRDNALGIKGVAKNVKIMPIRVVPNGDERDKDVANGIYYAVDNGAQIINMSFGKSYSPNSKLVKKAIKYAESKDVLIVHASGNENEDIDKIDNFPTAAYTKTFSKSASNWIEVGANNQSTMNLFANFSNFGKQRVDLFAPGVEILSTVPGNKYANASGTSMATPVVSGVAAIILSEFPALKPFELKEAITMTANRYPMLYVYNPKEQESVLFSSLSNSGSIPNIFNTIEFLKEHFKEQTLTESLLSQNQERI